MRLKVAAVLALFLVACGGESPPAQTEAQVAHKRAHLANVVDELRERDVSGMPIAFQTARAKSLEILDQYADRGVFPHNTDFPGFEVPYFIDEYGTHCALAYVAKQRGAGELIKKLADVDNHAYVHALTENEELKKWLYAAGLTLDEAAYIQAPGLIDVPTSIPVPNPAASNPAATTTSGRRRGPTTGSGEDFSWETWWELNREAFMNLRQRYHEGGVTTPSSSTGVARPRRPGMAELNQQLLPFLAEMANRKNEVRATAIMAYARAAREQHRPQVVAEVIDYLRDPESGWRDMMLLALGIAKDQGGVAPLKEILRDSKAGRRTLHRKTPVPERTRAFAAIALGQSGDESVADELIGVLGRETGNRTDLRTACIASLGLLARDAGRDTRVKVVDYLRAELKKGQQTDTVLAAIPTALAKTGDPTVVADLGAYLARFRGPKEVRQSCALALGLVAPRLEESLVDTLIATARRDTDTATRRFAAVSLGELCVRDPSDKVADALVLKIARFYVATLDRVVNQPRDKEWFFLGAGLFARRFPAQAQPIVQRLIKRAASGGVRYRRSSAVIALGLSRSPEAVKTLRDLFASARDKKLRGFLAEAVGMVGDKQSRDDLLTVALEDPVEKTRYQAAIGLGYLADAKMVPQLVDALRKSKSVPVQAALTRVIGEIGDKAAIDSLIKIAKDDKLAKSNRERALGALGLIGQEADHGWTFDVKRGYNFVTSSPAMLTILALF